MLKTAFFYIMIQNSYEHIAFKVSAGEIETFFYNEFERIFPLIKKSIKERWKTGQKPDGSRIGLYSWYSYSLFKEEKNPLAGFGVVDLTLTGSLGDKLTFGLLSENEYMIFSTDEKYRDIVEKYGEYNFNITDKERYNIVAEITKKVVNEIIKIAYYE